jgi:hypothetical protein
MYKLLTIGALVAALAVPASAAGHGIRPHRARAQVLCPQTVVILPGRNYGVCDHRFWVRDPETGQLETMPFGRMQHMNQRPDDHP